MREPGDDDEMIPLGQALIDRADMRRLGMLPKLDPKTTATLEGEARVDLAFVVALAADRTHTLSALATSGADLVARRDAWKAEAEIMRDIGGDTAAIDEVIAMATDCIDTTRAAWRDIKAKAKA